MDQIAPLVWQVAMGVGLAACAGLRAFLPLLIVSIAGKLELVPLADRFEWLGTWPAIIVFGVAVVAELLADKIPLVDNVLDLIQGVVKPTAGALLAVCVISELSPLEATVLGIIAGASTAGAVHVAKAKVRLFSSTTTAGLGNPILSVGEDAAALGGSVVALAFPFLLAGAVVAGLILLYLGIRKFRMRAARLNRS
jgi:uncharacterized membrane protein